MGKGDHYGMLSKDVMSVERPVSGFIPCHVHHDYCFTQTLKCFKVHYTGWEQVRSPPSNMKTEENIGLHCEWSVLHS